MKKALPSTDLSFYSARHIPALDGLRGLAVALVVLYHCFPVAFMKFGWAGVDLFFVLSGFLITGILLDTRQTSGYYTTFLGRRALRIFPLYYLVLIIVFHVLPAMDQSLMGSHFNYYENHESWFWTYLQNWRYSIDGMPENHILVHFWSLAVEEQFYIVWPWIIKFCPRKKILPAIILLSVTGIAFRFMPGSWLGFEKTFRYMATFSRMDALLIGAMVAVLIRDRPAILKKLTHAVFIGSSFAILCTILYLKKLNFPELYPVYTFIDLFFGCLLIYSLSDNPVHRVFTNSRLIFLGKYSYGLYVYHYIILLMLEYNFNSLLVTHITSFGAMLLIGTSTILLSIGISWLSYHFFEKYFLKLKKIIPYSEKKEEYRKSGIKQLGEAAG